MVSQTREPVCMLNRKQGETFRFRKAEQAGPLCLLTPPAREWTPKNPGLVRQNKAIQGLQTVPAASLPLLCSITLVRYNILSKEEITGFRENSFSCLFQLLEALFSPGFSPTSHIQSQLWPGESFSHHITPTFCFASLFHF